ncbi:basic proline-rich protein-like [Dipodomys spectabilis]|uniref:basic proline-rich protein-like n=1 Tax=Dipodomys spectabilis TaxID=105255 RepID=UPI001C545980|nr:basic proline-rich protein-like [Dipodomys spectabilis]
MNRNTAALTGATERAEPDPMLVSEVRGGTSGPQTTTPARSRPSLPRLEPEPQPPPPSRAEPRHWRGRGGQAARRVPSRPVGPSVPSRRSLRPVPSVPPSAARRPRPLRGKRPGRRRARGGPRSLTVSGRTPLPRPRWARPEIAAGPAPARPPRPPRSARKTRGRSPAARAGAVPPPAGHCPHRPDRLPRPRPRHSRGRGAARPRPRGPPDLGEPSDLGEIPAWGDPSSRGAARLHPGSPPVPALGHPPPSGTPCPQGARPRPRAPPALGDPLPSGTPALGDPLPSRSPSPPSGTPALGDPLPSGTPALGDPLPSRSPSPPSGTPALAGPGPGMLLGHSGGRTGPLGSAGRGRGFLFLGPGRVCEAPCPGALKTPASGCPSGRPSPQKANIWSHSQELLHPSPGSRA